MLFRITFEHQFIDLTISRDITGGSEIETCAGRMLVVLPGLEQEGGEFAFSCLNRCHYFDPKSKPCLIAT